MRIKLVRVAQGENINLKLTLYEKYKLIGWSRKQKVPEVFKLSNCSNYIHIYCISMRLLYFLWN